METTELRAIAHIRTDFPEKFGIPRQSGLLPDTVGRVVFTPEFCDADAVRGLDGFDYLWLIWRFSDTKQMNKGALVRPPRLGGQESMGVFATRSPYRPNPLGLSSVRLLAVEEGPVLVVAGADLRDGTEIFDIKPYLPYTDSHEHARAGFAADVPGEELTVVFPDALLSRLPEEKRSTAIRLLSFDPRPRYATKEKSRYGVAFAGFDIHFSVEGRTLTVLDVTAYGERKIK